MSLLTDLVVPALIAGILIFGIAQRVDVFDTFVRGAKEGISTALRILPPLVALMTAVEMFKASGAIDLLTFGLRPLLTYAGIPEEVLPLALLRPISGSGAMAIYNGLIQDCGPDSFAGRVASVLQGSTETTFYTIAVYYGAVKVKNTRHTLPSAAAGDLTGLIVSTLAVRLLMGG